MPTLRFDEQAHEYHLDGIWVPGVTSILGSVSEELLYSSAFRRKNAIGKAVHKLAEAYNKNEPMKFDPNSAVQAHFAQYLRWVHNSGFEITGAEIKVYSVTYRYAGILDIKAIDSDGKSCLVDIKCVAALQPTTALQLAAYRYAWNEMFPEDKVLRRYALQLTEDSYTLKRYIDKNDFNVFVAKLTSFNWDKTHGLK